MNEVKYTTLESQLANAPCLCEDTEEMFWLREAYDLLSGQYRFREALNAYHSAEETRADASVLYIWLGGYCLSIRRRI